MLKASSDIVQIGAPVLRQRTKPVAKKDVGSPDMERLIANMRVLLAREKNGVGLAAPQVGVSLRLFIVAGRVFEEETPDEEAGEKRKKAKKESASPEPHPGDRVFINPEVIRTSRKQSKMSEGCLSVRDRYGTVMRHEKATVRALDERGVSFTYHAAGLLAQIFQHEIDHLDGALFVDKAVSMEKEKQTDRV